MEAVGGGLGDWRGRPACSVDSRRMPSGQLLPTDVAVRGRRLEAHVLPVGALDVLKVVRASTVVLVEQLLVHDNGIPDEEVGEMAGQRHIESLWQRRVT